MKMMPSTNLANLLFFTECTCWDNFTGCLQNFKIPTSPTFPRLNCDFPPTFGQFFPWYVSSFFENFEVYPNFDTFPTISCSKKVSQTLYLNSLTFLTKFTDSPKLFKGKVTSLNWQGPYFRIVALHFEI